MLRQLLFIGVTTLALPGVAQAQARGQSRDDLLDAVTRHIQICGEITDTQQRLSCYDRLQTQVGGVAPAAQPTPTPLQPAPTPTPTPLQASPAPLPPMAPAPQPAPSVGSSISSAPLSPQPLAVPGGGVATLPGGGPSTSPLPPAQDPNAAFDPRTATYRAPDTMAPRPQPQLRRTGPRPIPYASTPQPLVTLGAHNLTYGDARYWQVTVTLTSNTSRPVSTQAECTFMNGGRPVSTDYLGPVVIQPGEQLTNELIGPPTTTYVDSTNCRVVSP